MKMMLATVLMLLFQIASPARADENVRMIGSVSYTHLTLPTIYSV